jgi:predicted amidohydrolase YtcJ
MKTAIIVIGVLLMATSSYSHIKLFINAQLYTGLESHTSADAFITERGRFTHIGESRRLKNIIGPDTEIIDLKNAFVMPGFIEAHAHLLAIGQQKLTLDLRALSTKEIADLVMAQSQKQAKGTWIRGRGWDQNLWPSKAFPHKDLLKAVKNPVYLRRVDGHAILVNDAALLLSGISDLTQNPPGGTIVRDQLGKPSGVLIDNAMALVERHLDKPTKKDLELYLNLGINEALSLGITSFHDAGVDRETLALYEERAKRKDLKLRIYAMIDGTDQALTKQWLRRGPVFINDLLTVRSFKLFADGALGSRGASLLEDYHDQPGNSGLLLITEDDLAQKTEAAINASFQVATHAIGDAANRLVLNAYERALKKTGSKNARLRIEHAQLVDPSDQHRFKKLAVIASMQPIHCTSDMAWVSDRLGHQRITNRAYPWRSLLNEGALLAFGSDGPVEGINPILGIFAAVTRTNRDSLPKDGFMPEQKLKLKEALHGYHRGAAFAEFNEHQKGLIKEGYWADFVVFDQNLTHPQTSMFLSAKPKMTVLGGEIVFER